MSRVVTFAVAWLVAAVVAVGVAWQGVGIVGDQVTQDRPPPLTAGEIQSLTDDDDDRAGTTTTTTAAPAATPPPDPPPAPPGAGSPGPSSGQPGGEPVAPPPATNVSPAPTESPTTSTTAPPAEAVTRTYNVTGGSASLRFSPSGVTVAWANPAPGFRVDVEPEHGNGVKVEFESDSHRSRIDGWWSGGPQDRVREEAR